MSHECIVWRYYQRVLNVLYEGINNALNIVWRSQRRLEFIVWRYQQVLVLYLGINVLNIVS